MRAIFFLYAICILFPLVSCDGDYDGPVTITLFHHLDEDENPNWIERGVIVIHNVNTGTFSFTQENLDPSSIVKLQKLAEKDMLYRLKAVATTSKGNNFEFYSFTKAGTLVYNNLVSDITFFFDHTGSIVGFVQSVNNNSLNENSSHLSETNFNTAIHFKTFEHGPVPDTATYIQKIEREREAKERGVNQDNRSFFAKYWIYIVPIVIFAMLSGTSMEPTGNNAR